MEIIDIFYQREGITEIEHIEIGRNETFAAVRLHLEKRHGFDADVLIFVEDEEEPLDMTKHIHECAGPAGVKLHFHRCRHIKVAVNFTNETAEHSFSPGATIARVKQWAAERKFGMSPEEAGEHVLQIAGTQDRPTPGTHIGALVKHHHCQIAFDLVPDHRINGASEGSL